METRVTIEIVDSAAVRFLRDLAAISLIRFAPETAFELPTSPNGQSFKVEDNAKNSVFGRLNAYANPSLIQEENNAWEESVAEKYAVLT